MIDHQRRVRSGTDERGSGRAAGRRRGGLAIAGLLALLALGPAAMGAAWPTPGEKSRQAADRDRGASASRRSGTSGVGVDVGVGVGVDVGVGLATARLHAPRALSPADDGTFRPTVLVRRGPSQGSGTIIASVDGETLVLTAAHVIRDTGPISIELHRYNLGLERTRGIPGPWPQPVSARLAAADTAADLAVLRIEGLEPLPYVARLAPPRRDPAIESTVTSIGIDLGTRLSSWSSRLVEVLWFELNDSRDERLFFLTARTPEYGRSGGGLFLPGGELIGVCVGHAELVRGHRLGVFASRESIQQLLMENGLDAVVERSELRQARLARRPAGDGPRPYVTPGPAIAPDASGSETRN